MGFPPFSPTLSMRAPSWQVTRFPDWGLGSLSIRHYIGCRLNVAVKNEQRTGTHTWLISGSNPSGGWQCVNIVRRVLGLQWRRIPAALPGKHEAYILTNWSASPQGWTYYCSTRIGLMRKSGGTYRPYIRKLPGLVGSRAATGSRTELNGMAEPRITERDKIKGVPSAVCLLSRTAQ